MTPRSPRKRFARLLDERVRLRGLVQASYPALQAAFAERLREYKRPWRALDDMEVRARAQRLELWERRCIAAPAVTAYVQARAEWEAELHWIETQLDRLAREITPKRGPTWTQHSVVWGSTYSTQGFGANHYAKNAAEQKCDHFRAQGLDAEVRKITHERPKYPDRFYIHTSDWAVWVRSRTQIDVAIAERRPGPSLREWIKLCWKRGVNPRVYNPYIPVGIEERLGLDYYGGEVAR